MSLTISTADFMDGFDTICSSCTVQFRQYGAAIRFSGRVRTVQCYDDNVLLRRTLETRSEGEVMVVDGAGFLGSALIGDQIAELAIRNGWAGLIIYGGLRDTAMLRTMNIGIKALGSNPKKSGKHGIGLADVPVTFGGVTFSPGEWLYSDEDGVIVSPQRLDENKASQAGQK